MTSAYEYTGGFDQVDVASINAARFALRRYTQQPMRSAVDGMLRAQADCAETALFDLLNTMQNFAHLPVSHAALLLKDSTEATTPDTNGAAA